MQRLQDRAPSEYAELDAVTGHQHHSQRLSRSGMLQRLSILQPRLLGRSTYPGWRPSSQHLFHMSGGPRLIASLLDPISTEEYLVPRDLSFREPQLLPDLRPLMLGTKFWY